MNDDTLVPDAPPSVTHIAGLNVAVQQRWVRQRCAWCGTVLVEHDLGDKPRPTLMGPDGQPIATGPAIFPIGVLVRVRPMGEGTLSEVIQGQLPEDFCGQPTATQEATDE